MGLRDPRIDGYIERAPERLEYVDWSADAKRDETRDRRIGTAVEWIAEGKPRHWKNVREG